MAAGQEIRRRLRPIIVPVIGTLAIAYFAYYAVQGDHGLIAFLRLSQDLKETEAKAAGLAAKRQALEKRVGQLRPDAVERDLLDERARVLLNFAHPDDITVLDSELKRKEEVGKTPKKPIN